MANNGQHDFIEFVCKPVEDLYLASGERRTVRISEGTEYRCSMLRDQHFSSLFRHYGKHNGVDKDSLVFFFTEELMQELQPSDTPRSVHLRKNDVIVIRHRRKPETDGTCVRLDLCAEDALRLISRFPRARSLASADGRTPLHHVAARGAEPGVATKLLLLGCDPSTLDNYGRTAMHIAEHHQHHDLATVLRPHEFRKQMAVVRAHFVASSKTPSDKDDDGEKMIMKRHCPASAVSSSSSSSASSSTSSSSSLTTTTSPTTAAVAAASELAASAAATREVKQDAALHFLFSKLAVENQARNFKRVVCFLYA